MDLMIVIAILVLLVCVLIATLVMKNYDLAYRIIECIMDILRKNPDMKELIDDKENQIKHSLPDELKDAYQRYIDTPDPKPKKDKDKKKGKKKDDGSIKVSSEDWKKLTNGVKEEKKDEPEKKEAVSSDDKPKKEEPAPKKEDKPDDKPKDQSSKKDTLDEELKKLEKDLTH